MSRILIYGGQGYVGAHIIEKLYQHHDIYNISPSKFKKNNLPYVHIHGHLWDKISKIQRLKPEYFIIVFFGNPKFELHHLYEKIVKSIGRLDKILKNMTFIFISSQLVYGCGSPSLKSENEKLSPVSVYAKKCQKMEKLLIKSADNSYVILRVPILYGNKSRAAGYKNMVNDFISMAEKGEDIGIYGSGKQARTFLHVEDLARMVGKIIEMEIKNEIINASTKDFFSVVEIARMIAKRFNVKVIDKLEWPKNGMELEAFDIKLGDEKSQKYLNKRYNFKQYISGNNL